MKALLILITLLASISTYAAFITSDRTVQFRADGSNWVSDNVVDNLNSLPNTAPTITLTGSSSVSYTVDATYSELGATCSDTEDGTITVPAPTFSPTLNMASAGTYTATYTCTDSGSLTDSVTRTVYVNSAGGAIAFANVTASVIDNAPQVVNHFWAGMPDVNGDGCIDIFIGSHAPTQSDSAMYLHDNVGGVCQGTFTHFPNANNYSNSDWVDGDPRITSRYMFGNWYGHPAGMWSFKGSDVDGSGGAKFVLDPTFTTVGGEPQYLTATHGCFGSRPKCIPLDIDGDGVLEMAYRSFDAPYNAGRIVDKFTGALIYDADGATNDFTQSLLVFDVDNDGIPEIVSDNSLGYWKFNAANGGSMDWQAGKFDSSYENVTGNHKIPFDYDNDGDIDLAVGTGIYDAGGAFVWSMYQNDGAGNFTDVSSTVFAGLSVSNTGYWTTYANSVAADIDNDGDQDILFSGETYGNAVTILVNTNGVFSADRTIDFEEAYVNSSGKAWVNAADYDNDGRIDIVKTHDRIDASHASVGLFRNTINTANHYMRVRVRGPNENTDGLHSRITFFEAGTNNIITHYQVGAFGLGSQNLITHAGLGLNTTVDMRVELPHGGATCNFSSIAVDRDVIVYPTCNIETYNAGSAIPLTYVASNDVTTTMTLVADSAVTPTSTELVTFGLPFEQGAVTNLDEIKVSIGGSEVAAYVEQGLTWWSDNSIRSVTIQLQNVDMTGGDVVVTIDDTGFSTARLTEQAHSNGWTTAGADKNNHSYPRIFALHDTQYLADSGLIPPYDPAPDTDDAFEDYQVGQFTNWSGGLDYSTSTSGNWLFDRSSAYFKAYMTTGRVEFLKEAFLSKQFYFTYVKNDGTTPTAAGGDGCFEYGGVACADGKYIAPQQAKLTLALTGDNSQFDDSLIIEMAIQADLGWNQYATRDLFDNENEGFTERGAGLAGLAEVTAYEMTGDATILSHLNERITSLKDMQQTEKAWDTANGWTPKSGGFTHNIGVHEGNYNEGNAPLNDTDERGFSSWMSENIADFLWQAYHVTGNSDVPEMLRLLGNAIENYGFTANYDTVSDTYTRRSAFTGQNRTKSCNTTGDNTDLIYMASSFASDAQIASNDWWPYYSDTHNIETVLPLSLAYKFETDATNKEKLLARINQIESGWINAACDDVFDGVHRLWNWQHRSNSIRTWDRILREDV